MAEFIDIFYNGDDDDTPFSVYDEKGNHIPGFGMVIEMQTHPGGEPCLRIQARELHNL